MLSLRKTLAGLARHRSQWERLMQNAQPRGTPNWNPAVSELETTRDFGSNPGNLRMFSHVPSRLPADPALVVVLHGCKQTAAGYDHGAGWSTLADRYGFALLLPEQQPSNNPNSCFNWFLPGDTQRDRGEALSIRQMIETMVVANGIDRRRVFITGLSAGGAMTSVMLACYPEVFAAGAIIAGLPYGAASNVQQAFESMFQSPARSARAWSDLVRNAAPHDGPWPRVSIWHGNADTTVIPANAHELLKQWTGVHGLPLTPSDEAEVDGYSRQVWRNAAGDELVEYYNITRMMHGTPLATGSAADECGASGPFLLEVGISSSYHIARFFALTGGHARPAAAQAKAVILAPQVDEARRPDATQSAGIDGEILDDSAPGPNEARPRPMGPLDIGAVITNALKAAGLMRRA